ncbi:hypothetical protein EDD86DRAFT_207656 [Gorgonomyces haynaldii]|nr:hypothetical protein EDD86DRAFT_207656 [Gorgonomyces haynaldii]
MPSYLLDMCDFNISYQGCSNKAEMAFVDLVFIVLHSICSALYVIHLVKKFMEGKLNRKLSNMDKVAVLCIVLNILRVLFRVSTRLSGLVTFSSDEAVIVNVRFSLYLEHFFSLVGSLALKLVLLAMVEAVSSANLIVPVTILGKEIDPSTILKLIRIVAIIVNLTLYSFWAFWAVSQDGDYEKYKHMRRLTYIIWGCVSSLISAPINYYFGKKLISTLRMTSSSHSKSSGDVLSITVAGGERKMPVKVESSKSNKKDIALLKYAFQGVLVTYIWVGVYFCLYIIFNETLQAYPLGMLIVKVLIDSALLVVTSFILYFMFQKT